MARGRQGDGQRTAGRAAATGERASTVRSVTRALGILQVFAQPPHRWGITELAARVGLAKGTVHLLVQTLLAAGYLEQEPASRKYRLGSAALQWLAGMNPGEDLRSVARRHLERLTAATGLPSYLAAMVGEGAVLVEKAEPPLPFLLVLQVGITLPLHSSALAKLLLAHLPPPRQTALLERLAAAGLPAVTPQTITDPGALAQELAAIARQGYALDREESLPGLFCVAVPIRDGSGAVVAALAVGALTHVLSTANYRAVLPQVQACAAAISAQLGYRGG